MILKNRPLDPRQNWWTLLQNLVWILIPVTHNDKEINICPRWQSFLFFPDVYQVNSLIQLSLFEPLLCKCVSKVNRFMFIWQVYLRYSQLVKANESKMQILKILKRWSCEFHSFVIWRFTARQSDPRISRKYVVFSFKYRNGTAVSRNYRIWLCDNLTSSSSGTEFIKYPVSLHLVTNMK